MAACHGIPCGVLAWDDDGTAHALADAAVGAAVTADGMVVIAVAGDDGEVTSIAVDPRDAACDTRLPVSRRTRSPSAPADALAGIETGPDAIGLIGPSGHPSILEVRP